MIQFRYGIYAGMLPHSQIILKNYQCPSDFLQKKYVTHKHHPPSVSERLNIVKNSSYQYDPPTDRQRRCPVYCMHLATNKVNITFTSQVPGLSMSDIQNKIMFPYLEFLIFCLMVSTSTYI